MISIILLLYFFHNINKNVEITHDEGTPQYLDFKIKTIIANEIFQKLLKSPINKLNRIPYSRSTSKN